MIILLEKAYTWYEALNKKIRKNPTGKIIIITSMNIDSITSLRILVGLLKSDVISYEIIPVQNYDEVEREILNCKKIEDEIQGFVFINCIGEIDLTKFWFCQEKNILTLVAESKRPMHHKNLRNDTNIVVIDDGNNNLEYCPTEKEMELIRQKVINVDDNEINKELNFEKKEKTNEENEEEENDKEESDEKSKSAENDQNDNNISKKKIIKKRNDINDEDFNELKQDKEKEKDALDEIADEVSAKPEKQSLNEEDEENSQERKLNEKIREVEYINNKVNEYYGGSYYGLPSTYIFYSIAHQLHKENSFYLWYLIISLTDEYLRYHISDKKYDKLYAVCQNEVLRIEKKKSKDDDTLKIYKSTAKEGKTILIGSDSFIRSETEISLYEK